MDGFLHTLLASFIALAGSFALGVLIAVMRITAFKPLQWIGTAYVEFIRNIPLLLITFVLFRTSERRAETGRLSGGNNCAYDLHVRLYRRSHQSRNSDCPQRADGSQIVRLHLQSGDEIYHSSSVKSSFPARKPISQPCQNSSILGVVAGLDLMYQADLVSSSTLVVFDVYIFVALFI